MRFPKNLPINGTIGFLAPSFGCATEPYYSAFQNALRGWQEQGYAVKPGPNCLLSEGIGISNTPEKCGMEVMEMFADEESDVLISCGGGELMCEDLDYIDFERLVQLPPKWYMGYSDNTNLTYLLATLCDMASIYGPCASAFGMEPWHPSLGDAWQLLTGEKHTVNGYDKWERESLKDEEHPLLPYHVTEPRIHKLYVDGQLIENAADSDVSFQMQGRLLGGCMDCLVNLLGTEYDRTVEFAERYREDGILWFLEACDLNVFGIRRAMWQMEHAGWFRHVKGFLFGRPRNGESMMGLDACQAVLETAKRYQVPVIMDMDIGHLSPMMPLVTGSIGMVKVQRNDVEITMKYE